MYIILAVQGCFPYINLLCDETGKTLLFDTEKEAQKYGHENCAWQYKIVNWDELPTHLF